MKTIPQNRDRMKELAAEHNLPELADLAEETRRRPPLRRAPPRWPRLNANDAARVREAFAANPNKGVRDLADEFKTSVGRISEAVRGFRTGDPDQSTPTE